MSPNLTSIYSQEGCAPCQKPFPPSSTVTLSPWPVNGKHRPGLTDADAKELRDYKNRVRLLEQENEIMRRAAIYLGRGLNPK